MNLNKRIKKYVYSPSGNVYFYEVRTDNGVFIKTTLESRLFDVYRDTKKLVQSYINNIYWKDPTEKIKIIDVPIPDIFKVFSDSCILVVGGKEIRMHKQSEPNSYKLLNLFWSEQKLPPIETLFSDETNVIELN